MTLLQEPYISVMDGLIILHALCGIQELMLTTHSEQFDVMPNIA